MTRIFLKQSGYRINHNIRIFPNSKCEQSDSSSGLLNSTTVIVELQPDLNEKGLTLEPTQSFLTTS